MTLRRLISALAVLSLGSSAAFAQATDSTLVERGRYLAVAADCKPCHTVSGEAPFSGGRPIDTPFGVIASANITPDANAGIGGWSEDDFISAVQRGKGHDGRRLYPAMPYPYFTKMNRDDVRAIYAYLRTVPANAKPQPANTLPFPFNIRFLMAGWNLLFFKDGPFETDSGKSAEWNRGAYLVQGAGHCGACHTPKNFLGGDERDHALEGATIQYWRANDLRDDKITGLGQWSQDDLVVYLKTGHNRFGAAGASMAEVVSNSTSQMNDGDVRAIAIYLKDLPARDVKPAAQIAHGDAAMQLGQMLYVDNCTACHGATAAGVPEVFPMLKDNPTIRAEDPTTLIRVLLEGTQSAATDANPSATAMPSFGWKFSDPQIAAVLTYIRNSGSNTASPVSQDQVAAVRKKLPRPE